MSNAKEMFVTTSDNPYNYFTEFDDWYAFDEGKGYCTCGYVARIAESFEAFSDEENILAINKAVKDICRLDVLGIYKPVYAPEHQRA